MNKVENAPSADRTGDGFSKTAWSLVLAAGRDEDGGPALERLCRKYWRPMYVFARRSGLSPADAEDMTQGFFAHLLEREWLKRADPRRGSFRAYLLTLLRSFMANYRRWQNAGKRRGPHADLSLDAAAVEQELSALRTSTSDPARAYEATWARGLLQVAWDRLVQEQSESGKSAQFDILRPFVIQPPAAGEYGRVALALGLRKGQVALLIHRLSRRYGELIRAEVAETLSDPSELEGELRYLLEASAH